MKKISYLLCTIVSTIANYRPVETSLQRYEQKISFRTRTLRNMFFLMLKTQYDYSFIIYKSVASTNCMVAHLFQNSTTVLFVFNDCSIHIQRGFHLYLTALLFIFNDQLLLSVYSMIVQFLFNELFFFIQRILRNTRRGL